MNSVICIFLQNLLKHANFSFLLVTFLLVTFFIFTRELPQPPVRFFQMYEYAKWHRLKDHFRKNAVYFSFSNYFKKLIVK